MIYDDEILNKIALSKNFIGILKKSDMLLDGYFTFNRAWDMEPFPSPIFVEKWDFNHVAFEDHESNFMMARMEYLIDLNIAYQVTREEKYFVLIKSLIDAYYKTNHKHKRTIDTGIRIMTLSFLWPILNSKMNQFDKKCFLQNIKSDVDYLEENYVEKYLHSNWGIFSSTAAILADHVWNINSEKLKEEFDKQLTLQILDDGNHWEQSPLYNVQVLLAIVSVQQVKPKLFYKECIIKMVKALKAYEFDGWLLPIGDSDNTYIKDLFSFINGVVTTETDNINAWEILERNLTFAHAMVEEKIDIIHLKNSKIIKASNDNSFLFVSNAPLGSAHGHLSPMNIVYSISGEDILIDPGRFTYKEVEIRNVLKSLNMHNCCFYEEDLDVCHPSGSWTYKNGISRKTLEWKSIDANDIYIKGHYSIKNNNYTRHIFFVEKSLIVVDINLNKKKIISNFVLGDKQTTKIVNGNFRNFANFNFYNLTGSCKQEVVPCSKKYGEVQETTRIQVKNDSHIVCCLSNEKITNNKLEIKENSIELCLIINKRKINILINLDESFTGRKYSFLANEMVYGLTNIIIDNKKYNLDI